MNELMVRNIHVDTKKRIYLGTDSGVYRYSNRQLIKLDDKFNHTGKAFNGPISSVTRFDHRHLIITVFPNRFLFFDTAEDAYVLHPFSKLMGEGNYQILHSKNDVKKITYLINKKDGLYAYNSQTTSIELIHATSENTVSRAYQDPENSAVFIVDTTHVQTNTNEPNKTQQHEVQVYSKTTNELKLLTNHLSTSEHQQAFFLDNKFVLSADNVIRIFYNQQLLKKLTVPLLCDFPYPTVALRDAQTYSSLTIQKGASSIMLVSPCGIHEYNITTSNLRYLYKAPKKDIGKWYVGRISTAENVHLIVTKTALFLLDDDRFEQISAMNSSSHGGSNFSVAKIDDYQYLVADGTPGLHLATNMISAFQTLTQADLVRLTGGDGLRHAIKDENNNFWLSSQTNGLILASLTDGRWVKREHFLKGIHVRSLFEHNDELWVATEGAGLWLLDIINMEVKLLDQLTEYTGILNYLRVKSNGIYTDQILISTTNGVLLFDLRQKRLLKKLDGSIGNIWAMAQDSSDHLWFASHQTGLHKLNANFKIVETYNADALFNSVVLDMTIDNNEQPVLATWGAGVLYRKLGQQKFSQLNSLDGLRNDTVQSILRAKDGKYWVSTELGLASISLCQFDDCEHNVETFTRADGLPTNLFDLNSAHKNMDGSLIFGGFYGLTWFNPTTDIRKNSHLPSAHNIDSIFVDGKNIVSDMISTANSETIELPFGVSNIRLRFSSNDYISEGNKQYRYKINSSDWIYVNTPEVAMPAPDFGDYLIEASSSNSSGLWSHDILQVSIRITPPFWLSNLALILYVLLFIILTITFYRIKSLRLLKLNQTLQKRVANKTKELAQKNTELQNSINQQKRMFEDASHDLKTPISIISSCHELIRNSNLSEHAEHHIRLAMKHSERLKVIVNRILLRQRERLFGVTQHTELTQLVVTEINDRVSVSLKKRLRIINNIPSNLSCYVTVPENELSTIVGNILDNAIKYSPPLCSTVEVTVVQSKSQVYLSIADEGQGLKDITLFGKRYYRENENLPGSGIGVSSAQELAGRYSGNIAAKNRPSGGLEVTLMLPLLPSRSSLVNATQNFDKTSVGGIQDEDNGLSIDSNKIRPRVLYVEDELDMFETFTAHCARTIDVIHASDGRQAISLLKRTAIPELPDVILSDVMMPNMDGYELCTWLKNAKDFQHIPFVLLTAKSDNPSQTQGLASGADDYVDKLVSCAHIIQKLVNIVNTVKAKERRLLFFVSSHSDDLHSTEGELVDPFVKLVRQEFNKNLSNSEYAFGDLCNFLHKSESTVARSLHKYCGKTFSELLFETRMHRADNLLIGSSHLRIGKIAEHCGFESFSYFSKRFKERYSMSPSTFRKLKKNA